MSDRRPRRDVWKRVLGPRGLPTPHLPLKDNLHPAGQKAPARHHGALGLPQQPPVEPPKVLSPWCAARDGRWVRRGPRAGVGRGEGGGGEGRGSVSGPHPDTKFPIKCPRIGCSRTAGEQVLPTHQAARGTAKEKAPRTFPRADALNQGRWGSWDGSSGPAPLRPSGRAPPSAPEPRSESDSCARGNWVFPNRAQPLGGKVPALAAGGGQILTFSTRRPER